MQYRNDPKFSDRQAWANSTDPDQTAPRGGAVSRRSSLIRVCTVCHSVCTVCHSVCIVWTHYCMVEPYSSDFRVITKIFLGVRIFRKFTVKIISHHKPDDLDSQYSCLLRNEPDTVDELLSFETQSSRLDPPFFSPSDGT